MGKHLVFVYGTLKSGHTRASAMRDQRYIGIARTEAIYGIYQYSGYPALITDEQAVEHKLNPSRSVYGELYEVDEVGMMELDKIEGVDRNLFERKEISLDTVTITQLPVESNVWGSLGRKKAEAYFFKNPKLLNGAKDCGSIWTR